MTQPVSHPSIQQYMGYLQQQMIHTNSANKVSERTAGVRCSQKQRIELEILVSRQLRRLS
jgi:hypothetical protein